MGGTCICHFGTWRRSLADATGCTSQSVHPQLRESYFIPLEGGGMFVPRKHIDEDFDARR
jgi:hypothetical protein